MRKLFTTHEYLEQGRTRSELDWALHKGTLVSVGHGVLAKGPDAATRLESAVASVYGTDRTARALVAATIHDLDGLGLGAPELRRVRSPMWAGDRVRRHGVWCANGLQTVVDIAPLLTDSTWEMANESGLHKKLFTVPQLEALLPTLSAHRVAGAARIRRVLALRPPGAPPTESALETLMVQLIRLLPTVPEPTRQFWLYDRHNVFVARIDLCWPELGIFIELDGEGHRRQPVYDAIRQSNVTAATGWLCGRFTWTEVNFYAKDTARRMTDIVEQARRRPFLPAKSR
jgi:hypothetical protein